SYHTAPRTSHAAIIGVVIPRSEATRNLHLRMRCRSLASLGMTHSLIEQTTHRLLTMRKSNRFREQLTNREHAERREAALGRNRDRIRDRDLHDRRLA